MQNKTKLFLFLLFLSTSVNPVFTDRVLAVSLISSHLNKEFLRDETLPIAQNSIQTEAQKLYDEGMQLYQQGTAESLREAINKWEQALPLWRKIEDKNQEALTLLAIASAYPAIGEKQKALDYFHQALPILRAIRDRNLEALIFDLIALIYSSLGEKQKALDYYNQALPIYRAIGDKNQEATILNNIGLVYSFLGEKQKALDYYNQALSIRRAVGDRAGEATTLNNIGFVYSFLGEKQKAFDYFHQALPIRRAVRDRRGEANTLNNLGSVYDSLGEKQKALDYYNQALPISREVGDREGEANTLNNLGSVYDSLGEKQKALDYYNQALPIYRAGGDREGEANTLNNLGSVYYSLGEKQKALDYYNQALPISREVGDRGVEATILHNIGAVYSSLGEKQKALDYSNQALPIIRAVGDRRREANTLNNLGFLYHSLGEKYKALDYYNQALPIIRAVGNREGEANTLSNIAFLEKSGGNLETALTNIEESIKIIEEIRGQIASTELRQSYFATKQGEYQLYIDILMELHQQKPNRGYDKTALEVSERARARTLLELLNEGNLSQGLDPQVKEKRNQLLQQLSIKTNTQQQLLKNNPSEEQLKTIQQEITQIQIQLQNLDAEIRQKNPDYARLTQVKLSLNAQQIQQKLVDNNTVLLSYWLGKEKSYLWLVTPNSITSYILPPQADIEQTTQQLLEYAQNAGRWEQYNQKATPILQNLSQTLLAPVAEQIANKRLIIVADGALQYLPFSLLQNPKTAQTLVETNEIVNLPSASTLDAIRERVSQPPPNRKQVAILANPVFTSDDPRLKTSSPLNPAADTLNLEELKRQRAIQATAYQLNPLPGTETEAQQILALIPDNTQKSLKLGFEVNRQAIANPEIRQYRLIHLATHGFFNQETPENSGIALSLFNPQGQPQLDGLLLINDVFNLNLPADLVVLSACSTIKGKEVKGEGIVGLTRGLIYAGAKRVVISLWDVDDEATAVFMNHFYKEMLENNLPPAQALRATQLWMQTESDYQAPEYWAAFVIQGEWR